MSREDGGIKPGFEYAYMIKDLKRGVITRLSYKRRQKFAG